ncbi:hypothetical protein GTW71_14580 [Streptomyces sp. SID6041]|nr:hypothetical protein [Streptomyces sp. SID6041]
MLTLDIRDDRARDLEAALDRARARARTRARYSPRIVGSAGAYRRVV